MTELIVHASGIMIEPMVHEDKARKEFSVRLALACDKAGLLIHGRQADIAARMKVTPKAVSKWFNGESIPRRGTLQVLASILGTSSSYLLGDSTDDGISEGHMAINDDIYRVEVFDINASAGSGVMLRDEFIETIKSIEYSSEEAHALFGGRPAENIKMIAVNGDSMSGTFEPRDQIFIDVSIGFFDGDGIYIFILDNNLYVKRLQLQYKRLAVISDNKKYETWYIDDINSAELIICAKVLVSQSRAYHFHG
ncbi:XRE family transcriptional regulator [Shimwellia blattae]|uniref:Phage-related repressor protein CI n=1 Tax=Shimwellia blattae (strain ATCC 29907 / DSM 4481 / JCM 1650 / NBRC 105725 / CDC 9005-74) TaxID=630626 RepID=I2B9U0_SHIBC|nr:S24 family peptidase [Shimwellia blattae]AFJ47294.1 phage-related repressor protein CI [Shimwellia blattae DSM 4481 = NBRC 105725]GAB80513.1 hypothetical protein EB105725_05_02410 [Shimwellia blattae DSM 4481 = NBRC 105725]VDY64785.1 Uncharacterized HTH-type transcriptional regulator HI_1476 [Shimwellia blattae]VEC22884.1 Uncharacterized HTH-type transcriptional regulator HI_1476 [Shimwellia blattae]